MLHHINPVSGLLAAALFLSAPVQAAPPRLQRRERRGENRQ